MLTGRGPAFCSGADVKAFVETLENDGPDALHQYINSMADALHPKVVLGLRNLEKPVVGAVNGVAAGAGFSLTLGCDIRYAAQSARFLMAYANIGPQPTAAQPIYYLGLLVPGKQWRYTWLVNPSARKWP
ncbi:MAG: hypothetical protein Ct9H300mP11_25050 [Chloroflexota bacterium]|nr:MAG: hypothetical protein Ct9H300mP11_25050 [Chloroflexota bacterium]